jgi:hypothetical protein
VIYVLAAEESLLIVELTFSSSAFYLLSYTRVDTSNSKNCEERHPIMHSIRSKHRHGEIHNAWIQVNHDV